ncbi:MAG: helix-turn-helix domain-containing protein [Lachnospiraceae bacterium]|nr:helix-turn-helix domain-containing protein [Lachnospiraceae bacterium]
MKISTDNKISPSFYTVRDIQKIFGIGRNSAYKLVSEKDFPSIYIGNRIVIPADKFQNWIDKKSTSRKGAS